MNFGQALIEALESLSGNKLRSGLTILGIVIGVAAVIAMLGVGQGAQDTITGSISGIGSNLLFVFSGNEQQEIRNLKPLTLGDVDAMADPFQAPSVALVAPVIQTSANVSFAGESTIVTVTGVTPEYGPVRNFTLDDGEFITDEQNNGRASVALLGVGIADKLFGHRDGLIGETIRIEGQPFRVAGILTSKGGGSFGSEDNVILVPFNTARSRLVQRGRDEVDVIFLQSTSAETVSQAEEEVAQILRVRHRTALGVDDFTIYKQQDILETVQTITGIFTVFMGGVAGISLLVGGIGIMNIMLVSVTERTREIGLRKALGARKKDILIQFLTESSVLSLMGGFVGILFGWLIAFIVGQIAAANNTELNPSINLGHILLATAFSTAVGLFFGIYPANRAANLEPVEALRYE